MVTQAANRGPGQWMGGNDRGLTEDKEKKVLISAQKSTTETDHSKEGEAYQRAGLGLLPSWPIGPGGLGEWGWVDKVLE